jgi:hypothetical protein
MRAKLQYIPGTVKEPQNTKSTGAAWQETSLVHFPDGKLTPIPPFVESPPNVNSLALQGTCRAQWAGRLGGSNSGAYYFFGTHSHLYSEYNGIRYNITPFADQKSELLGTNPLGFTSADATMDVTWTAHGLSVGDEVTFSGATDAASVNATTYINISHRVATVTNANVFTVELGTTAGSTTTGGGSAITAYAVGRTAVLGTDPVTTRYDDVQSTPLVTVSGSNIIDVYTFLYDEIVAGDSITISGIVGTAGLLNGIPVAELNTTHTVLDVPGLYFRIRVNTAATSSGAPTESGSVISMKALKITYTSHGLSAGDRIKLSFATGPIGGVPASEINKEHVISVIETANTFIVPCTTAATSLASGGGTTVSIFKQIASGNQNQSFLSGYGAGLYGAGLYGTDRVSSTTPSYPRISSFDNFGNQYIYCPGDYSAGDGQKLYIWDGDTDVAPQILDGGLFPNAPTDCNWVAVVANQIVALCGTNIVIGLTDPSTGGATFPTVPSTTAYGDVIPVQRSTRLLSIAPFGEKSAIVFAPEPLLLRLVGGVWDLVELGNDYPIVSPSAFCKINDGIMWYAQDGNYYFCDGGPITPIINRQNGEYVRARMNQNAIWTSFMMADQKHNQAWHYYPSTGQSNPDSYVIFNPSSGSFTTGTQSRTSAQRPSKVEQRFYMTNGATVYSAFNQGVTDFAWSARTAFFYIEPNSRFKLTRLYPNTSVTGTVSVKVLGREHAQDEDIDYGTFTFDSTSTAMTVRGAGRLIAFEFSGTQDFMLEDMEMEVQKMGTRRL